MKNVFSFFLSIMIIILSVSCAAGQSQPASAEADADQAKDALLSFLQNLHEGDYQSAAQLYGGSYDLMREHNPEMDPNDEAALLQNACTLNGAACLQVKSAELDRRVSATEFVFKVEFSNPDGTLLVRGPCCGGNETDFPPESEFYFSVTKIGEDSFAVMDMPPYMP